MPFDDLRVGQAAEYTRTVTPDDVAGFAAVTGDHNPVHVDEEAGRASRFGARIAHGLLGAGYISACLSLHLPGPGTVYLSQTLRFLRPVRIGDTVTARVEVLELIATEGRVRLATTCRTQAGETVIEGEATVLVPDPDSGRAR
jgi:3-hydroxybutyryl-CoA dehydratase